MAKSRIVASSPFDDPEADAVLRSYDEVDFHVFKFYLIRASRVFKEILEASNDKPVPVLRMPESETTLAVILSVCCGSVGIQPISSDFDDLDAIQEVLEAANIYGLDTVRCWAETILTGLVTEDPVRVYTIACMYGFKDVVHLAAEYSLRLRSSTFESAKPEELDRLSTAAFKALAQYRAHTRDRLAVLPRQLHTIQLKTFIAHLFVEHPYCAKSRVVVDGVRVHRWLDRYMHDLCDALYDQPFEGVITDERTFAAYIKYANGCYDCRKTAVADLKLLSEKLRNAVQRETSAVRRIQPY